MKIVRVIKEWSITLQDEALGPLKEVWEEEYGQYRDDKTPPTFEELMILVTEYFESGDLIQGAFVCDEEYSVKVHEPNKES